MHVYLKCTAAKCVQCGGFGEYNGGACDSCGGSGRTPCGGCRAEGLDCWYDTLSCCAVCGGLEGSLLPECPGRMLTPAEHETNYAAYCAGTGPFRRERLLQDITAARVFAERYVAEDLSLSAMTHSEGARRFYDAVNELWQWIHGGCRVDPEYHPEEGRYENGLA